MAASEAHAALRDGAHARGREPGHHVAWALHCALADLAAQEDHRVAAAVHHVLDGTTPARLLAAVAHALATPAHQGPLL